MSTVYSLVLIHCNKHIHAHIHMYTRRIHICMYTYMQRSQVNQDHKAIHVATGATVV